MNENIDRRVVEMRFDNTDFEKNVESTMSVLEKLKQHLSFNKAGKDFTSSGLPSAIDDVKNRFSALEVIGVTALANITNSAVNLGKRLARSLTVDQVKAGFSEYELKMGSIQTIMASTGEDLDYVNKKLNELNTYSDRTIYSFSDMTQNIGKFTNAGVKLDTAVKAIQGISNEAAVSGANAQEASRAMYNFAQALSAGYVKLIDWKSIENANMATVEFKQQLIDSAVAAGTLEKQMDGTYKVLTQGGHGAFKESISATKNFNDSLSAAWMTTDVLTSTLAKYSDETTAIGKKAFAAAQDVKTFSQLMDTIKESIGSGWAQTFEIIFGNLEEAKKLWTAVNNVVSEFVSASSDARNLVLQTWKDLGGREDIAKGIKTAFGSLRDAYMEAFPSATTEQLTKLGEKLKSLTEGFAKGMEVFARLKPQFVDIFTAVSDVVGLAKDAFSGFFRVLSGGEGESIITKLFETFVKFVAFLSRGISALVNFARATGIFKVIYALIKGSYDITAKLVDILSALVTKVSSYAVTIEPILEKTSNAIGSFFDKIDESKIDIIGKAIEGLGKAFSFISESVIGFVTGISQINLSGIAGLLAGGGVFAGALKFSKLLDAIMDKMEQAKEATGIKDAIKGTIDALTDSLSALTTAIKATALRSIATAVLELAIAMKILASIDGAKLKDVLGAITAMFIELGGAIKVMLGITSGGTLKQMFILTRVLSSLSKSLIFMALAAKILSTIDWGGLARGLVGIGAMLLEIGVFMKATSSIEGKAAKSFMGVAISLMLMAKALEMLGKLSWKQIVKGLGAMGGILFEISVFSRTMNSKGMASMGLSMILIASSMIIFGEAMEKIGRMPFKQIEKGLIGIGGSLTAVAIAMRLMPEAGAITSGLGILIVAESLKIMAGAISTMGGMSLKSLAKGLGAMAVALFEIVAAINFANSNLRGAASIFILAEALRVIAGVMTTFGNMNLKQIGKGILAMAGALGVLIAAGFLAGKVAFGLLALGGAVALLGAGVLAAGAGIMLMASGLSLLVGTISVGLPIIMTFLTNVIMLIPLFIQQLGYGIIKLFDVLSKGYDSFVKFGVTLLTATMDGIIKTLPKLEELIGVLLETISNVITNDLTMIVDLGIKIIFGLLDGITKAIPNLVQKAFEIVITFINSMASAIDRNGDALRSAFVNLIKAILKFLLDSALDFFNMGKTLVGKLKEGVASIKDKVKDAIKDVLDKVKDKIREYYEKFKSAGSYIMEGLKAGIKKIPIIGTVVNIADRMNAAFKNRQKIASPSKVWKQYGIFITQGLANGLTRGRKPVVKALNKIISAFDINGVLVAFTSTSMSSIKGQIDRILENTVNSISWAKNVINQYLGDFTNAQRRSNGTYAASTAVYKGASKAVANFSTKLYKNSQAYQDSAANVQNYNAQIAKEQSNYRTLQAKLKSQEKAYKKAGKKRKKQIKKQIVDTKKAMNESLKNIQNLNASLKKELQNIANGSKEAYQAYRENLREIVKGTADILKVGVNDYVSLFERMDEAEEISVNDLLSNMQSQIKGISKWKEDLDKLGKRGIARGLLDKLEAMGPEGAKYIKTFLKMSDEELRKANVMFQAEGELTSDTLIRNMRTQLNAVNNWSDNITKIARKGIKYDFLKDLVDAGPDNAEYVQALADMTEAEIAEINALYVKQGNLPSNVADNVLAALSLALDKESRGQLAKSTQTITSAVSQALTFGFGDAATEAGTDVVQALSVGIKAAEPTIKEASKFIGDSALTEFKTFFSTESGNTVAVQMTNGIVSGLTTGQLAVREAARALAESAYTGVTDELEIHSPSKKMEELGKYSNLGFANGLKKYARFVEDSASSVSTSAYDTLRDNLKRIYEGLGSDVTNPVITPTLDLSNVSRQAGKLNDMFNDQKIGVNGSGADGGIQNGKVFNFTQNNYSPKALPRIDIYRNTKNLLSVAKGKVGK